MINFSPGWAHLIGRELRAEARGTRFARVRVGCAGIAMLYVLGLIWIGASSSNRISGSFYYNATIIPLMIYCLASGVFLTSDAISSERREGTLPQLFLSNLRAFEIVVGKLFSRSAQSLYGLIACFPAFGVSVIFGGVTGGEFWRMTLVLALAMLFSVALGLLVSTTSGDAAKTSMRSVLGVLAIAGGPYLLRLIDRHSFPNWNIVPNWITQISPFEPFLWSFDGKYGAGVFGRSAYWDSVAVVSILTLLLGFAASINLARNWRDPDGEIGKGAKKKSSTDVSAVGSYTRREPISVLAPYAELSARRIRIGVWDVRLYLVVGLVFCVSLAWNTYTGIQTSAYFLFIAFGASLVLHLLVKHKMLLAATLPSAYEKHSGFLEMLAATPLPVSRLATQRFRAIATRFWRYCVAALATNFALCVVFITFAGRLQVDHGEILFTFLVFFLGGALRFVADSFAMVAHGMLVGYRSGAMNSSPTRAYLKVQAPSWVAMALVLFFFFAVRPNDEEAIGVFWFLWVFFTSAWSVMIGLRAMKVLGGVSRDWIEE